MLIILKSGRLIAAPTLELWDSVVGAAICRPLCSIKHVFDKNAVAHCGVVYEDMGHCADELAVLDNGAAGHADVK